LAADTELLLHIGLLHIKRIGKLVEKWTVFQ